MRTNSVHSYHLSHEMASSGDGLNQIRIPRIENRVPRIRDFGSLQVHTGCLTFSLEKKLDLTKFGDVLKLQFLLLLPNIKCGSGTSFKHNFLSLLMCRIKYCNCCIPSNQFLSHACLAFVTYCTKPIEATRAR